MSPRTLKGLAVPMFALAITAVACGGGGKEAAPGTPAAATAPAIDPATAATITGTITLDGTAPTQELIKMNADPICMKEGKGTTTEYFVTEGGKLANVMVYLKEGVNGSYPAPSEPV